MQKSILAIETCSETCSVALVYKGQQQQIITDQPRGHADNVLPLIDKLLGNAQISLTDLDAIAFTRGPGAFTGVRIGTAVSQGLAVATGLPLLSISSLAVLAQASYRQTGNHHCLAALDARMSEVYFGIYQLDENHLMLADQDDQVAGALEISCENEQDIILQQQSWQAFGPGWINYPLPMQQRFNKWNIVLPQQVFYPEAIDLLTLAQKEYQDGKLLDAADALPVYVRDQVVRT